MPYLGLENNVPEGINPAQFWRTYLIIYLKIINHAKRII